jgi:uncharacterized repeat protein (TIGR03803 family)
MVPISCTEKMDEHHASALLTNLTRMRTGINTPFGILVLATGLGSVPTGHLSAQTFTTLYAFTARSSGTNSDGAFPSALVLSNNTLYGTAESGGASGAGTVFSLNIDGTGFTNLYNFTAGSDGAFPASLILAGNRLYGTALGGGSGHGTVFALNTDGTESATLHTFTTPSGHRNTNSDGSEPYGGVIKAGDTLYGTAENGGASGCGTVFAVSTDGTSFTTVHDFSTNDCYNCANTEGASPMAGLVASGSTLYGTATWGGSASNGTVFAVNVDGSGLATLHGFTVLPDGANPTANLVLSGDTLYGTARYGGNSSGSGTVFKINTNGTGFAVLHTFGSPGDAAIPFFGLALSGNTLYATTVAGGGTNNGTVFAISTDGTGYTILHRFTGLADGAAPGANLIVSGSTLFGTAGTGGSGGSGTVFAISLPVPPPQLAIAAVSGDAILTWSTNATGFTLQSTTNLAAPAAWTTNLPAPVVVNGQYAVTNPISSAQQFFRLSQ